MNRKHASVPEYVYKAKGIKVEGNFTLIPPEKMVEFLSDDLEREYLDRLGKQMDEEAAREKTADERTMKEGNIAAPLWDSGCTKEDLARRKAEFARKYPHLAAHRAKPLELWEDGGFEEHMDPVLVKEREAWEKEVAEALAERRRTLRDGADRGERSKSSR